MIVLAQVVPHLVHNDGSNYTRRTPQEISKVFRERNHWCVCLRPKLRVV
jgi:hypothetical protein